MRRMIFALSLALAMVAASDARAQDTLQEEDQRAIHRVAFSPDGKLLACGGADTLVRIWDVATKTVVAKLKGHTGDINGLQFSPDGKTLASGDLYKGVKVWDVASKKAKGLEAPGPVLCLAFGADGKRLYLGSRDPSIFIRDPAAPADEEWPKLKTENEVNGLDLTKDGQRLVSADGAGKVILWNLATGEPIKRIEHGSIAMAAAFSPDGKTFATGGGDGFVKLWDGASGEAIEAFSCPDVEVNGLAFAPDGKTLLVATHDGFLKYVDPATGAVRKSVQAHEQSIRHVAASPDGKWAATGCLDGAVKLWPLKE